MKTQYNVKHTDPKHSTHTIGPFRRRDLAEQAMVNLASRPDIRDVWITEEEVEDDE